MNTTKNGPAQRRKSAARIAHGARTQPAAPGARTVRAQTILVPVDFSEQSQRALEYACRFARTVNARLLLLHVLESFPIDKFLSPDTVTAENSSRLAGARSALAALETALPDAELLREPGLVRVGKPFETIVQVAKDKGVDLIIVGSHGYTGVKRLYLGSTAERIVRLAPCHVLVVRE